jgi:hypothetical protein
LVLPEGDAANVTTGRRFGQSQDPAEVESPPRPERDGRAPPFPSGLPSPVPQPDDFSFK